MAASGMCPHMGQYHWMAAVLLGSSGVTLRGEGGAAGEGAYATYNIIEYFTDLYNKHPKKRRKQRQQRITLAKQQHPHTESSFVDCLETLLGLKTHDNASRARGEGVQPITVHVANAKLHTVSTTARVAAGGCHSHAAGCDVMAARRDVSNSASHRSQ